MPEPQTAGPWLRLLPWLCGAVAAAMAVRNLWHSPGDFGIYLDAAREMVEGSVDIYRPRQGPPYPYPHAFLLPIAALQAVLSDRAITILWALGLGLATKLLVADLAPAMRPFGGLRWWQWVVFGCLFQRCIAQNLTHGQLSLWVAVLLLRGSLLLARGRGAAAGAALGAATALKLTPIAYSVALPAMRRPLAAAVLLLSAAALVLLLPWPFLGAEHWRHLHDFWRAMLLPLFDPNLQFVVQDHQGPSVAGTFDYLLQPRPFGDQDRVIALVALSDAQLRLCKLAWCAVLAALCGFGFLRANRFDAPRRLLLQSAITMLGIAFFAPHTNVYHLAGALLPAALFCQGPHAAGSERGERAGGVRRRPDWLWWSTALAFALALTLRQKKLIGEALWRGLADYGLLHVALVLLLVWLCRWIHRTAPAKPTPPATPTAPAAIG